MGDSLTNDNSSPDVTRGRLEASIAIVGRCSFRVRVTDNYNYNSSRTPMPAAGLLTTTLILCVCVCVCVCVFACVCVFKRVFRESSREDNKEEDWLL